MRILISTPLYPPSIGGPATYTKLLQNELPRKGIAVDVVSFDDVRHLPKIVRHIVFCLKVIKKAKGVDLIYAQDPFSVGFPSLVAAFIMGKPFYLKVVGDYAWEMYEQRFSNYSANREKFIDSEAFQNHDTDFLTNVRKSVERFVAKKARKVLVPSQYLKKIVSLWGVEDAKIDVVYNAFDLHSGHFKKRVDVSEMAIISAGRLVPWKGFGTLIEILPKILRLYPSVRLYIAGEGPLRAHLENKALAAGMKEKIKFLGRIEQDKLQHYIKASALFILNTGYEGFSHQLLEVMALGVPIVTTNVGGNPELIEQLKEGILVSYDEKDELVEAILYLLKHENVRQKIAAAAFTKVGKFGKDRMIDNTVKFLYH